MSMTVKKCASLVLKKLSIVIVWQTTLLLLYDLGTDVNSFLLQFASDMFKPTKSDQPHDSGGNL